MFTSIYRSIDLSDVSSVNKLWFGWVGFYSIVGYLMPSPIYTYAKYIWFGLVGFYGVSTIIGYLMPYPLHTYTKYIWFSLVGFHGISTIVGFLMPNPLCTFMLSMYYLVWLCFMAYQPL